MTTTAVDALMGDNLDGMPELVSRAIGCASAAMFVADAAQAEHPVLYANAALCRLTGYTPQEILGGSWLFLQAGERDQQALAAARAALSRHEEVRTEFRSYRKDGSPFWSCLVLSPVADAGGDITHVIGVLTEITEQKQREQQQTAEGALDPLTALPNRHLLSEHLQRAIADTPAEHGSIALLVLNIDHFKQVNGTHGYACADALLKTMAERLQKCIEARDTLSRHGADEFAIVLREVHAARDIAAIAETLAGTVALPCECGEASMRVTCSIGIAIYPQDGGDAAALIGAADMALHRAKEIGRDNTQFFSREIFERSLERAKLETALRHAIDDNSLTLYYQPLVDLQTGRISGLEALLRWNDPELGEVEPTRLVAVAEQCGFIDQLGEQVLRRACCDMRAWDSAGIAEVRVAVNVSPHQFRDPHLAEKISSALADAGIEPRRLCLEITENALMQDTPASRSTLARLRSLGIDLVLDDFGTGYSSLGYLKKFFFDKVKIDRSFIGNIGTGPDDGAIATAVISMAHSLGIRVVAEGVETEAQCDFLRRNMCDEIQGFLFAAALPPEEAGAMLRAGQHLPDHLLRLNKPRRTLLLVDDEVNIVSSLKRLLRPDNYTILTAHSGMDGLEVLSKNEVDVIVSDQRMPGMTGVEFLGKAKEIYPDTVRIVLSGYTELQSVTDAVNQGAIYKFLTKPWDDTQLRGHIAEAFQRKEMADENRRLALQVHTANFELAAANRKLEEVLQQQQQQIRRDEVSLDVVREVLQQVPAPVIGLDEDNVIVFVNTAAQSLFRNEGVLLGESATATIPDLLNAVGGVHDDRGCNVALAGAMYRVRSHSMGQGSESRGRLLTLIRD